jgi:DNA helicase-2/ATP-dependent DNA helicase PcrA
VLYRVNALGRALQTAFTKSGVPYRVIGDMGFYDRKEVKDMIAYLSVVSYPGDNLRLKRIINEPKRKIGAATVEAIESLANANGLSMYNIIERIDEYPVLAKSREKLLSFVHLIEEVKSTCTLPSEMLSALFEKSGYRAMLEAEGFEGEGKIENVNELITAALEYEKRVGESEEEPTLMGFLEEVFLISDVDKYDENADAVVLMTVHAAKGLEFPVVFIAGMEDGIFPSEADRESDTEMSEERRLAYVAITRAKEMLYISYAKERMMYGRTLYGRLSTFIREELPVELTARDIPRREPPKMTNYYTPYRERSLEPSQKTAGELSRKPEIGNISDRRRGAEKFGVERLSPGDRVAHAMFGEGLIISSRDMGGDVLYEVAFDNGQTKKLMATFAKLKKI